MNEAMVIQLMLTLVENASAIGALFNKTRAEGRQPTEAELDALAASDDKARDALVKAIAAAKE